MRRPILPLPAVLLIALAASSGAVAAPSARPSATCSDYATQAEAQHAGDTVDGDQDGLFCESLSCPCADVQEERETTLGRRAAPRCERSRRVVEVGISSTRYPAVLAHIKTAVAGGWPRVLRINRAGAEERRARALRGWPTRPGYDRDEWPMAMARRTWRAHIAYVPSGQNRGAGASISLKLRRYCDGVRFAVVGY
ncbi:NucA/NucB deoxyribonuclease domain-containing protein [Conexibacter stalactiti]|uniref:NucA/NucB deoxyribonuclease domain-containing protein n=1 Tax=Conexibacter stalactiti TaxID=1940611 RepID=A0ABU4HRJ8_9ACTN|nr:NucA/NucB deoxyribonuclease domain-containing protein [Conexibacter stalactiti]MDW5595930.1 NucA/NucB deoxyribonuclease domain-containing protein [Conexibacter stalactiti]MEC5036572.1 NucA/NucB deoxyribonuclease domain-containing protein [Conexibacter stalactiti]